MQDTSISEAADDQQIQLVIEGKKVVFVTYKDESQLHHVKRLVDRDLSEPYSIFTYRYFLHRFPELCILAVFDYEKDGLFDPIGCIVCKIDAENEENEDERFMETSRHHHHQGNLSGYIGMLAVDSKYRGNGLGQSLVHAAVDRLKRVGCTSVVLEAESSNKAAMKLYEEKMGFIREQYLVRYYLNNSDAYRLRLWLK